MGGAVSTGIVPLAALSTLGRTREGAIAACLARATVGQVYRQVAKVGNDTHDAVGAGHGGDEGVAGAGLALLDTPNALLGAAAGPHHSVRGDGDER